jgi:hypothetical protein
MPTELILMADVLAVRTAVIPEESSQSATSWGAIAAGGIASAAFTLFLVELVAGLGLVMVSPWSNQGASASTLSVAGGIGLILMAVMASALGGYIAGRLRTRWVGIKTDEVYFRDTAHGLLAWAVGTIILATVLASAAGTIVSGVTQGAASNPALVPDRNSYYVDSLFRSDRPAPANATDQGTAEASRLMARALTPGNEFTANDRTRAAQLVAARTGLSQQEAEQRVDQVITQAKAATDQARKAAAKLAFWMAASLLAGALAASLGAIEGGRERDD